MKSKQGLLNIAAYGLLFLFLAVLIYGIVHGRSFSNIEISDGIEQVDLDTVYLQNSGIEVNFSEVILSNHNETRKLIVSTQTGTVTTKLTDRLIKKLDFDFMKKTQDVSYTGTGYFVVDLDNLTSTDITEDSVNKVVTIKIGHAYLQAIEINPNNIMIDAVKEGLLARGDIELTVADYNTIEKELRSRLEETFNTAANGQEADDLAIKMVKEVYEPIIKAIDRHYKVEVIFK